MKCKKCGGEIEIDFTKQLLSDPPKYTAKCKDCGDITYLLCSECHNTEGSCLQSVYGAGKINNVRLNELDSLEVNGTKEAGSINDVLWNEESITKIKSNFPYNYQKPISETCEPNYYYESNKPTDIHPGVHKQGVAGQNIASYFNYGWVCPKCGAVMSPDQKTCLYCSPAMDIKVTY